MTRNSEINMATNLKKTVNPQIKAMINTDQLAVTEVLQDDHSHCETEWRPEEDLSDDGASEMSPENRELWDYFLNNSDPYSPLCFSCTDEVNALDNYHCDDDELVSSYSEETEIEWSEEEDNDWLGEGNSEMSPENRELWDSFLNNSDPYSPLCFSCPDEVKAFDNIHCDDDDELVPSNHQETETEWSEEEDTDWSDEGDSEMSPENRELWDSFLNNSDPYSPLCFTCPAEVKASDSVHCDGDELVPCNHHETITECSEEKHTDWSDEGDSEMSSKVRELWDSLLNHSASYSPLCFSCTAEVKASENDHCDDDEDDDNYDDDDELVSSDSQETEPEWSEEEYSDWSDEGYSEMSPENRELWDSCLNNSDPYSPLCFSCPAEVKASDSVHCDDDELVSSYSEETEIEWSEEEDNDWLGEGNSEMSPENSELWDSFMNNSDPYSPLCFSCPAGLKIKASEVKQNHTPSSPTAREVEEHNPDQNTKVHFSEVVTIHTHEAWGFASQGRALWRCREIETISKRELRKLESSSARVSQLSTEPEFWTD